MRLLRADLSGVDSQGIECLNCGAKRPAAAVREECARCGYLGWAESNSLSETLRRALREWPVALRRTAPHHLTRA